MKKWIIYDLKIVEVDVEKVKDPKNYWLVSKGRMSLYVHDTQVYNSEEEAQAACPAEVIFTIRTLQDRVDWLEDRIRELELKV